MLPRNGFRCRSSDSETTDSLCPLTTPSIVPLRLRSQSSLAKLFQLVKKNNNCHTYYIYKVDLDLRPPTN
ncbi:hypothetical protein ACFX2C_008453 [Malus domestica]